MAVKLAERFWPGPLTMVFPKADCVPDGTTGGLPTVAVRMPEHPVALALIRGAGVPIAAPSANTSGRPSPTNADHVEEDLSGRIELILDGGDVGIGLESTIVDVTGEVPMILRPGKITAEDFEKVLGKAVELDPALLKKPAFIASPEDQGGLAQAADADFKPKSPGQKYQHYAPKAEMIIYKGEPEAVRLAIAEAKLERTGFGEKVGVIIYDDERPEDAARNFFAELRAMDKAGVDVIFAAALKEDGVGFAVMNRMFKSAGYHIIEV
jgi:L-threonylcarbamoyladenylate synthase